MRIARVIALAFTALCLVAAAALMLMPTGFTMCAGECTTVSCGSAAFPKELIDFEDVDDATNCAGLPSATHSLYAVGLAGVGLAAIALASLRRPPSPEPATGVAAAEPVP